MDLRSDESRQARGIFGSQKKSNSKRRLRYRRMNAKNFFLHKFSQHENRDPLEIKPFIKERASYKNLSVEKKRILNEKLKELRIQEQNVFFDFLQNDVQPFLKKKNATDTQEELSSTNVENDDNSSKHENFDSQNTVNDNSENIDNGTTKIGSVSGDLDNCDTFDYKDKTMGCDNAEEKSDKYDNINLSSFEETKVDNDEEVIDKDEEIIDNFQEINDCNEEQINNDKEIDDNYEDMNDSDDEIINCGQEVTENYPNDDHGSTHSSAHQGLRMDDFLYPNRTDEQNSMRDKNELERPTLLFKNVRCLFSFLKERETEEFQIPFDTWKETPKHERKIFYGVFEKIKSKYVKSLVLYFESLSRQKIYKLYLKEYEELNCENAF